MIVVNKMDLLNPTKEDKTLSISPRKTTRHSRIIDKLVNQLNLSAIESGHTVISNVRHYEALQNALKYIRKVIDNVNLGLSNDLNALDVKQALYHLGEITGDITTDDLLDSIFSNFCIGK